MGDGLVPLPSALGQHEEPKRSLALAKDAQRQPLKPRTIAHT